MLAADTGRRDETSSFAISLIARGLPRPPKCPWRVPDAESTRISSSAHRQTSTQRYCGNGSSGGHNGPLDLGSRADRRQHILMSARIFPCRAVLTRIAFMQFNRLICVFDSRQLHN